jgi:hypothetical protein
VVWEGGAHGCPVSALPKLFFDFFKRNSLLSFLALLDAEGENSDALTDLVDVVKQMNRVNSQFPIGQRIIPQQFLVASLFITQEIDLKLALFRFSPFFRQRACSGRDFGIEWLPRHDGRQYPQPAQDRRWFSRSAGCG